MKLTKDSVNKIESKINEVEKSTSGEIMVAFLSKSDSYESANLKGALLIGFLVPIILFLFHFEFSHPLLILWSQVPGIFLGYFLFEIPILKRIFLSKNKIEEETNQLALQMFFQHGLHSTKNRSAILIFISILEKKSILLADIGIHEKIQEGTWDNLLKPLNRQLKSKNHIQGIIEILDSCGDLLKKNFPKNSSDQNELKNQLLTDLYHQ